MIGTKRVVVVMPAYNVAKTLRRTYDEVVATGSNDDTVAIARTLPHVTVRVHEKNLGYGGAQKTCYRAALEEGGDIVVMIHPDYQYTPKLLPAMSALIASGFYDCVLASR